MLFIYSIYFTVHKFIEMGKSLIIPNNMPQPRNIYLEQIEVLKPLLKNKHIPIVNSGSLPSASEMLSKTKEMPTSGKPIEKSSQQLVSIDLTSPSGSGIKRVSNKGKMTLYSLKTELNNQNIIAKTGTMLEKLEKAHPYNIFFTTVIKAPETTKQPNGITLTGKFNFNQYCMFS